MKVWNRRGRHEIAQADHWIEEVIRRNSKLKPSGANSAQHLNFGCTLPSIFDALNFYSPSHAMTNAILPSE